MTTFPQGLAVIAQSSFSMRKAGCRGRNVTVGDKYWITNSMVNQKQTGCILVQPEGRGSIGTGYALTIEQFNTLFRKATP